ncbi:MAG: SPASM domain-containing protein [Magnetococcales bacterium]|nr:SPASM domain-containing protein [Magnetococcales bacterium]
MMKRANPFDPVYRVANSGNLADKLKNLPEFPYFIDLELTNTCDFRCLMCPTGMHLQRRSKGFMSDTIFYRLLDGVRERQTPLRFIRWGEPTLHPRLVDYLQASHAAGILTHMNTNGNNLDDALMDALLAIPLDCIKFSFQGIDAQSYREMRNTDFFAELIERIKKLHARRGDRPAPFIQISTTVTYETREQIAAFRQMVEPYADLVSVGRTILGHLDASKMKCSPADKQTLLRLQTQESVVKKHKLCPEVFDKLSINWDGTVTACCADYDNFMTLGNLATDSLQEIWHSPKMHQYRVALAEMRHAEFPLCRTCYDFMGLDTPGLQGT